MTTYLANFQAWAIQPFYEYFQSSAQGAEAPAGREKEQPGAAPSYTWMPTPPPAPVQQVMVQTAPPETRQPQTIVLVDEEQSSDSGSDFYLDGNTYIDPIGAGEAANAIADSKNAVARSTVDAHKQQSNVAQRLVRLQSHFSTVSAWFANA